MAKKRKIPTSWIYVDKDFKTTYVQDKKTGKMKGRKTVSGYGDKTAIRRVKKGHSESGEIVGRTSPIYIKGSNKSRGHLRRMM